MSVYVPLVMKDRGVRLTLIIVILILVVMEPRVWMNKMVINASVHLGLVAMNARQVGVKYNSKWFIKHKHIEVEISHPLGICLFLEQSR